MRQMEARRSLRNAQQQRRKRDNVLAIGAGVVAVGLAVVLQLTAFASNPTPDEYAAVQAGLASPSASPSPTASNVGNIPNPDVARGKTFTGTLTLNGKPLGVTLDGTKAPQAVSVFKTLADQNFFKGNNCHRLTTSGIFVLQCGSKDGKGGADPAFQWGPVENVPANGVYPAGTIAVARAASTYSNGTQFFVVYKDSKLPVDTGGYTVMGKVTSGLDAVSAIAATGVTSGGTSATDGQPATKVTIDSFTLK
ncbi:MULTISPECIES: peptidylprolyl isomerase [Arthrobacter]|uniref:peptidylprolyl isomerase n=3 Tax=Arthrobacter TaxID=1663 RepID=A0ABU9KI70_9MICC|nr:peptidylprolyl isomerase [Arthrobacter sp. YJM1]MDP5226068.1 peptidylprolyl isomerase [Arthrobacter sp. YJM1]